MTLLIEVPDTYASERAYVTGHVLGDRLGLSWELRVVPGARSVRITDGGSGATVVVKDGLFSLSEDVWLTEAALPHVPLPRRHMPGHPLPLPVLFGDDRSEQVLEARGTDTHLNVDVFGGIFFMLTRMEEVIIPARDKHGRFPDEEALLVRDGLDEVPLADAYVELLWEALRRTWPRLRRRPTEYGVFLTHDVDRPSAYGERLWLRLRGIAGDLGKRRDPVLALRRMASLLPSRYRRSLDP